MPSPGPGPWSRPRCGAAARSRLRPPPRTLAEALPVAAEHLAFCPDSVWQGSGTVRDYAAEALVGAAHWSFWWD
ncbi:DUF4253 domain-containing protein [Streptomyces sp. NPDC047976]|uniref:DUF4253 domain-containing protein n=1 Tax=Streptomyces sp. NPDC047976 TaxID=3155746 RepID=UPI003428A415